MGGAVNVPGNYSPVASFNVYSDPEAAKIIYESGIEIVQVGLDVCNKLHFTKEDIEQLKQTHSAVASALYSMLQFRIKQIGTKGIESVARENSIALNDVAAAAYLINPEWFVTVNASGTIACDELCRGQTVLETKVNPNKKQNIVFAKDVNAEAVVSAWLHAISNYAEEEK